MQKRRAVGMALLTSGFIVFAWQGGALAAPPRGASAAPASAGAENANKAKEIAQRVYVQGVDHFRAGRLLEALAAFRASYEMVPSPNSHLMIARALRDHGDTIDAYLEYGRVVAEAEAAQDHDPKYASAARASRAERAKLRERLTLVTITVKDPPEDLRVAIGDRVIDRASWGKPVPVVAGALVARATAAGRTEQRQDLAAMPGGEAAVAFDFTPRAAAPDNAPLAARGPAEPPPSGPFPPGNGVPDIPRQPAPPPASAPNHTWAYVSFGAGAAGLVTFITFGAINQSKFNDLQKQCPSGHCAADRAGDVDSGRRAQTIANVGFGVAVAGGALGCILLVSGAEPTHKTEEAAGRPGRVFLTDVAIGPTAVEVKGAF